MQGQGHLVIGTTLGPYRIDRELGAGGMGKVYAATDADGTVVALKVIHPHLVADADALGRFRREAEVGISIRHPNVVATLAAGEADGQHWLALEYVEGQTLHSLQQELGTVPEELCRHVAHEIAAGLAAIHEAGIVHRDMKPENVLITRENVIKVMDLGVARGAEDDSRLTQTGAFVGSLQYAAPEQFTGGGRGLDGRVDLHALGVLVYELATGANPYQDADWRVVFQKVLKETPRRLGAVSPQVSPFFEEVVHTLLAKQRDARFADAAILRRVLEEGESSAWWKSRAQSIRGATKRPLRRIKIPRDTALVGRDVEMAKLRSAFEKAKAGDGQVVLVEGEAGIGKSRLVDEFVALLQREGEDLGFLYGSYPPGGAATASGAFSTAYREHFGSEDLATTLGGYLKETPLLVAGFAALLTNQAPPEGAFALTKDSLQTCFVHATRAIAAERVAIVLIDDLHFAPDEGRALFASLALAAPGHRILLVGTSRPPLDEKWASNIIRIGHTARIPVGRLGARDLVALLRDALQSSHLAEELAVKLAEKTDGNPFFVFEVLRGLKDGHYLTQKPDGTWATTRVIEEIRIPASIADMIQARVGDLTEDERSLLEIAACAGFEFDPALVGDVAGVGRIPLLRTLGTIEKQHRLIRGAGRRYVFDHHQVQEHLYAGLTEFVREGYHAAIAESLERMSGAAANDTATIDGALCAEICGHHLKGAQGERALRYLEAAYVHLRKNYLNDAALRLSDAALAVPGLLAGEQRAKQLLRHADVLDFLGRRQRHEEAAREAVGLADASGDPYLRMVSRSSLGWCLVRVGRLPEAASAFGAVLEIARLQGHVRGEGDAEAGLGAVAVLEGRTEEAREHHERELALARRFGDPRIESRAVGNLGNALRALRRFEEADKLMRQQIEASRKSGERVNEAAATINLGSSLLEQGRLAEAQEHYERGIAICRSVGYREFEAQAVGNLGILQEARGRLAEAKERYEEFALICRENGMRGREARGHWDVAGVLRELGDAEGSEERYRVSLAIYEAIGHGGGVADTLLELGSLQASVSRADEARACLTTARDMRRGGESRDVETLARCELALLPGGDRSDALLAFAEHHATLSPADLITVRHLLWRATGDREHLAEAKRLLAESLAPLNAEDRASALANVRLHRAIMDAAKEQGL